MRDGSGVGDLAARGFGGGRHVLHPKTGCLALILRSLISESLTGLCSCVGRCEQELDECKSNPCQNGGYCHNLINKFLCVCDMSFAGDVCQTDVSDIYFYVALLLWQNLFQLLSYLILRLDDEPEIDWGGND